MLHLALSVLCLRLGHRLQGFAVVFGRESNELRIRVVACRLNSLIILNHDTVDVVVNSLAQEVIRVDIVEGGHNDLKEEERLELLRLVSSTYPGCISRLLVVAVLDERLQIETVADIALDRHILAVGHDVGELAELDLVDVGTFIFVNNIQAIGHVEQCAGRTCTYASKEQSRQKKQYYVSVLRHSNIRELLY